MTAIALRPESSVVLIVLLMASHAAVRRHNELAHRFSVATGTIEFLVSAIQLEGSRRIVIELP